MKYYILRYGKSEYYVGESRILLLSPNGEYVRAGTYEVVDDIQKAIPLNAENAEDVIRSFSCDAVFKHYPKPLNKLCYVNP